MLKYEYKNATIYITKPTEKHIKNIQKATEIFMKKVIKEKVRNESRGYNNRTSRGNSNARKRIK